jgi:hypothetical protein
VGRPVGMISRCWERGEWSGHQLLVRLRLSGSPDKSCSTSNVNEFLIAIGLEGDELDAELDN